MIHVRQEPEHGDVILEFTGRLEKRIVEELIAIADQQPTALRLVIDLSRATNVNDAALGQLVEGLPPTRARWIRVGNRHQEKLLGFLGEKGQTNKAIR